MASLSVIDYVVFSLVLVISAAIGIYHAWKGVTRTEEFFVANRQMKLLPVVFSLLASWGSAIGILGAASENYMFGTMYLYIVVADMLALLITAHLFIPIFYSLKINSVYEVRFHRFGLFF